MLRSLVPYSMWFIDFPVQTHTHTHDEDGLKSPTDSWKEGEGEGERTVMCEWVFSSESSGFVFQLSHSTVH